MLKSERGYGKCPCSAKEYQMTKEEKLKKRIEEYEEERKELNAKIRKAKTELRWLKIKKKIQEKNKIRNDIHNVFRRGKKIMRWE